MQTFSKTFLTATILLSSITALSNAHAQNNAAFTFQLNMHGSRFTPNQAGTPDQVIAEVNAKQTVYLDNQAQFQIQTNTLYPGEIEFGFLIKGNAKGMVTADMLLWRNGYELDRADSKAARQTYADLSFLTPSLLKTLATNRQAMTTPAEYQQDYQFESFIDFASRPATLVVRKSDQAIVSARVGNISYEYAIGTDSSYDVTVKNNGALNAKWHIETKATPLQNLELSVASAYVEKQDKGSLRVEELSDGVYRINGTASNYHSHFVVGDQSIAIFDAPVSPVETAQIRTLIEKTVPGKKISHVIFSHTHRDHIGGAASYLQAGVDFLTGKNGKISVARQFTNGVNEQTREIDSEQLIDLGNRPIRIFPINSSHASEMLVAYDQKSQTLLQGDFITLAEIGPVTAGFKVNEELLNFIQERRLTVNRILGVHGRHTNLNELKESVRLRMQKK
ncbi:MBL fold metallo-hydrolase [Undibacterium flavidum]|uniref:MBL fold metallo-hydrolase n=1 Tax=Undibacterium flavidum TaxID=2762297 RepID=A0ABR6YG80_9BURK|nr:MBL fold metallo-hydrolase [Undibacterium flavidum]MBC3875479.1 MBL fold metallo-hydrolase [Undibacterium flavidum]